MHELAIADSIVRIACAHAAGRCRACGAEGAFPRLPLMCGNCGDFDVELLQGEELLVDCLEVEEALTVNGGMGSGD